MKTVKECLETGCDECVGCEVGSTVSTFNEECYFYSIFNHASKNRSCDNMIYTLEYQLHDGEGNQIDEGGLHYDDLILAKQALKDIKNALNHII